MVEFTVTWMGEDGRPHTDTGRADMEKINEWNETIRKAVADGDETVTVSIPTRGDSDWSSGTVRAILVKSVEPLAKRPSHW